MLKKRLHILGLPHTITSNEFSHCAFTGKVLRFGPMMLSRGFEVYHYGVEGSEIECTKKIDILTEAREHFTYTGVLKQIEALMNDPFGPNGGYLRCIDHPRTERCCG